MPISQRNNRGQPDVHGPRDLRPAPRTTASDVFDYGQLDPGITLAVRILRDAGVETLWSCEGGDGHAYRSPTVVFRGDAADARRAVEMARRARLGPCSLSRVWRLWQLSADPSGQSILDAVGPNGLYGEWQVEFASKFAVDPQQVTAHDELRRTNEQWNEQFAELERRRTQLWPRLVRLEPELQNLFDRVRAGVIGTDDLWLTYFCSLLEPLLGPTRHADGDPLLLTREAFDAALTVLHNEAGEMYWGLVLRRADRPEARPNE